jgi:2-polyprenyl-6-methoxyphenol hydroxylase-like FAD-dependent oxidoreductase
MQSKTAAAAAARLLLIAGAVIVALALPTFRAHAGGCPEHPEAIGTGRTMIVDPTALHQVGTEQYAQTLPLRDHEVVLTFDDGPSPLELVNADDTAAGPLQFPQDTAVAEIDWEIERDTLLDLMFDAVKNDATFVFANSIEALDETENDISVTFKDGSQRSFALVFGCDGVHSRVRKLRFGDEKQYTHFLGQYFSITIVDELLIKEGTTQIYNEPGKFVMLNAYNNKTDIVLCFASEHEIPYDYRDEAQQRKIISEQFAGQGWRIPELLDKVEMSTSFYFDKVCQIKMPAWTKGKVALVGDAGYCASPAAGMGGSLAIIGAAALADAFHKHRGNVELAFQDYNESFHPYIETVQAGAANNLDVLIPKSEDGVHRGSAHP